VAPNVVAAATVTARVALAPKPHEKNVAVVESRVLLACVLCGIKAAATPEAPIVLAAAIL